MTQPDPAEGPNAPRYQAPNSPYPQQPYAYTKPPQVEMNVPGLVGLILSLVSIVICAGLISPIAIIVSCFGLRKPNKGLAIAGLVLGIIGIFLFLLMIIPISLGFYEGYTGRKHLDSAIQESYLSDAELEALRDGGHNASIYKDELPDYIREGLVELGLDFVDMHGFDATNPLPSNEEGNRMIRDVISYSAYFPVYERVDETTFYLVEAGKDGDMDTADDQRVKISTLP
ncbi:MAG: DUF4190 domain-containing protein [Sumerlaeia bacterium]